MRNFDDAIELDALDDEARSYYEFHRKRFAVLLAWFGEIVEATPEGLCRVLDVAPGFELHGIQKFWPSLAIDTMGFADRRFQSGQHPSTHYETDLNRVAELHVPAIYDVVICAEVIEHLTVPPDTVLRALRSWLNPGGRILLQTPNAVTLAKRVRFLRGQNPFMMAEESRPPYYLHVREYTAAELKSIANRVGLDTERLEFHNYFRQPTRLAPLFHFLSSFPPSFREGISVCFRRRDAT